MYNRGEKEAEKKTEGKERENWPHITWLGKNKELTANDLELVPPNY